MDVDKVRNPACTTAQLIKCIHENAILLHLPFEIDNRRLLLAFAEIESSLGKYNFRYEPAYASGGIYFKKSTRLQEMADIYGPLVSMSYGPMQILYCVAMELGYNGHPLKLTDPNESIKWVCTLLNRHGKNGATNLVELASCYNGGNRRAYKSNDFVLKYTQKLSAAYDRWQKAIIQWENYTNL